MRDQSTFPLETSALRHPLAARAWPDARSLRRPLLFVALVLYAFSFQGTRGIWEPDEGRYTAVALEMGRLGDYICPHLHHEVKHLTKPPLTYWLLAGSMAAFGTSEWAVRLPNALAFLATVLLVVRLGRRLAPASPRLAPWIYATSLLPFLAANIVTTDTLLTLWETLAVCGFVELRWGPEERRGVYRLVTRPAIDEVVFVGTHPRYGLAFYLDAEVEAVTLDPRSPSAPPRTQQPLGEELQEEEGVRLFVLPRNKIVAFRDLSRELGFTAVPRGGWRGLGFYELQRSGAPGPAPVRQSATSLPPSGRIALARREVWTR